MESILPLHLNVVNFVIVSSSETPSKPYSLIPVTPASYALLFPSCTIIKSFVCSNALPTSVPLILLLILRAIQPGPISRPSQLSILVPHMVRHVLTNSLPQGYSFLVEVVRILDVPLCGVQA